LSGAQARLVLASQRTARESQSMVAICQRRQRHCIQSRRPEELSEAASVIDSATLCFGRSQYALFVSTSFTTNTAVQRQVRMSIVRNARDFPTMAGRVATIASLWAILSTNALNASATNGVRSSWLPRLRSMLSWRTNFLFRFYPGSRIQAIAILKNAIQEE